MWSRDTGPVVCDGNGVPERRCYEVLVHVRLIVETPGIVAAQEAADRAVSDALATREEIDAFNVTVAGVQPFFRGD